MIMEWEKSCDPAIKFQQQETILVSFVGSTFQISSRECVNSKRWQEITSENNYFQPHENTPPSRVTTQ
jgi:hypothetical protein